MALLGVPSVMFVSEINPPGRETHYAGTAHMRADRALVETFMMTEPGETPEIIHTAILPDNPHYSYALQKLGGMKPGETKHFDFWD